MAETDFDVNKCIRLIPPFSERDVDKYFVLFERVATTLKWPADIWPLLLQCVFTGKAQEAYASLSPEASLNYNQVKSAVLRSYELVPEAYRQKFRRYKKTDGQSYVEFGREKIALFDRWCSAQDVKDFEQLRDVVLMEEFKNCLPDKIATYLNEQKVTNVSAAAVLADEYVLIHKESFEKPPLSLPHSSSVAYVNSSGHANFKDSMSKVRPVCAYCKKRGHLINSCFLLNKKKSKAVALVKTPLGSDTLHSECVDLDIYSPFIMKGTVSLPGGDEKVPVTILRDTAASRSIILQNVLPFSNGTSLNCNELVQGFGMKFVNLPVHSVQLNSDLVSGPVAVAICAAFPIKGVDFLLGNDLAGGKILVNPEVTTVPRVSEVPDEFQKKYPTVFPVCAVTRAMAQVNAQENDGLEDSFMMNPDIDIKLSPESGAIEHHPSIAHDPLTTVYDPTDSQESATHKSVHVVLLPKKPIESAGVENMSREKLISEQRGDQSLTALFELVVSEDELLDIASGYFLKNDILLRKWMPPHASTQDDWSIVTQIVVPSKFRGEILKMAHDNPLAGHLGVNKTYNRILRQFFWPGLKQDVRSYCKTCHTCQISGKSNPPIPPYPLYPIPAVKAPFDHVIVDCVGPLPRTKSGNQFLLTIMCASTRFPEAIPMRKITAPAVVKALLKFFSLFGLPKVIQTDQGTNFMSRVFAQVTEQLNITHSFSSAYHPESQGALERFHQTLKAMLRAYCLEFEKEWDDGVHLLLFAAREVEQESTGFSPADLVFAHSVRGPLKLLHENWLDDTKSKNLLDYVSSFRYKLHRACELATKNLIGAQSKMKRWFDKKAKARQFKPGDKVLVFLPIPGSSLQARYSGPYVIEKKVSDRDYIVATPGHARRSRLCHVNMIKPYYDREQSDKSTPRDLATVLPLSGAKCPQAVCLPLSSVLQVTDHSAVTPKAETDTEECESISDPEMGDDVPSQTHVLQHDIDVGDSAPIKQHPYRVNPEKRQRLQNQVDYMLLHGIAERSNSSWSSPCLLAIKSDGSDRFCTDFRKVNKVTKPDCHPLPRMEDCVDSVGSAAFVTKLDLLKGYWQVPLTSRAKEIAAFVTPDAFLQYTVMPFGVRNAPATFQRLVNRVLGGGAGLRGVSG
ncbi:uncharacterized protein [Misgurnus anguillicaudatus]|uniref:uncharacterized protein isoform X1 n=1 Tax=Misgurnus anguillicaudatus TaxID=75329 RepID=UPI003CCF2A24